MPDLPALDLDELGTIATGLTAEISRVEAVDGTARGPGEVGGPALRITVTITNTTADETSLRTAVVSCYFGAERTPAPELREPDGRPLAASVQAETAVDGVYIFTVPEDQRGNVTIMVDYSVNVAPLVFQGDVAILVSR